MEIVKSCNSITNIEIDIHDHFQFLSPLSQEKFVNTLMKILGKKIGQLKFVCFD